MTVEFHLYLPQMRMSMAEIVERAAIAERAGFHGIALMDHLAPPAATDKPMFEAITTAAWLAARTDLLRVGHLVLCDSFRHPALLAKQAVTLDQASGGRFELGLGWGSVSDEIEAYGIGDTAPRLRVARLAETLEVLRRLWSGEPHGYHGSHHTVRDDVCQRPAPLRHIPILIGGTGPRTLDLVASYADWWNLPINTLQHLEKLRPKAGGARISVQQLVTLIPTEADRDSITRLAWRRFGSMAGETGMVVGDIGTLTAHFRTLADRGVERCYVWFTDFAQASTLTAFGEVISSLS